MALYGEDRSWSDSYIPAVRQIVGPRLLEPASFELDAKEATDLLVFKARDMRIAARVRREGYAERYPYDFTIRSSRDSGAKTEMAKIIEGWGDWLFYGHAHGQRDISRWMIVDLHVFREALIKSGHGLINIKVNKKSNGDGTHFCVYDVRSFDGTASPILVAYNLPTMAEAAE